MMAKIKALRFAIARNPIRVKVVEIVLEALLFSLFYAVIHGIIVYMQRNKIRASVQKRVHAVARNYKRAAMHDDPEQHAKMGLIIARAMKIAMMRRLKKDAAKKARKA